MKIMSTEIFFCKQQNMNNRSKETNLPEITEKFNNVEQQMISDLCTGSIHTKHISYLFINIGLNIQCKNNSCEKYSGTGSRIRWTLNIRGDRLNTLDLDSQPNLHQIEAISSGSSRDVVAVTKFTSFTQTEQETLSIIKRYNKKGYIVVIVDNNSVHREALKYILDTEILNIYILLKRMDEKSYAMYGVCAFCNSGITAVKLYNSWSVYQGFTKLLQYTSSFKGEFFSTYLRVGLTFQVPTFFVTGKRADGTATYSGTEYMVLQAIADSLNFKIAIKQPVDGKACMNNSNLRPVGFCRMLYNKEVDIAGFPMDIDFRNYIYFDATGVYYIPSWVIISANPPLKLQWTTMASSTDPIVLIMVLVSYLVFTHLYWALGKYWYNDSNVKFTHTVFMFISILWLKAVGLQRLKGVQMLLAGMWMVATYFIISQVFGEITSIATSPQPSRKPIDSVEDMVTNKLSWVTHNMYTFDYGLDNKDSLQDLRKRKRRMKTKESLEYVLEHPNDYVYYGPKELVEPTIRYYFLPNKFRNPFHFSPSMDAPTLLSILVRKDAPYGDAITKKLLQLNAADLVNQKFIPDTMEMFGKDIKVDGDSREPFKSVSLHNMLIAIFCYVVGSVMSICVFIAEKSMKYIMRKIQWTKWRRNEVKRLDLAMQWEGM